ncbi:MAG: transporter [Gemmataceae bacterium]|nr:transporter [Gemmataceae bacterium]
MDKVCFYCLMSLGILLAGNSTLLAQEETGKKEKEEGDPAGDTFLYRFAQFLVPDKDDKPTRPDISFPGPDTATFPNSPYTLPKGRFYLETSPLVLTGSSSNLPTVYNWKYLLRYGVTDEVEFRLLGNGLTATFPDEPCERRTSGFAPLVFNIKVKFWDEPEENSWMPAMGAEIFLQTNFGSPFLQDGLQPGITLLFAKELTDTWTLEWSIGAQGKGLGKQKKEFTLELAIQWALEKEVTDRLSIFTHGYYNGTSLPGFSDDVVVGGGVKFDLTERLAVFGTYNAGVATKLPPYNTYIGLAQAF